MFDFIVVFIMENHPIPQDVTGFKFKLIGSITVKQFLYIVAGGILAAVCFILPITAFIRIPLAVIFGGLGTAIAFIPIDGRPMDVMLKNFLKALPAENQYIFKKRGAEALITEFFTPQTAVVVKQEQVKTDADKALEDRRALLYKTLKHSDKPDAKEQEVLTNINQYLHESTHSASPPQQNIDAIPSPVAAVQIVTPPTTIENDKTFESLQIVSPPKVRPIETPIAKPSPVIQEVEKPNFVAPPQPIQPQPVTQPEPQAPRVDATPEENIVTTPATPLQTVAAAPVAQGVAPDESKNVTSVVPETSLQAGFPSLPDTPNIVMGIIKDPRGKVIPNILVEIMSQQGIPVRAFKTNALGQFAAATPLPNGEYNVLLEDPRKQNEFEQIHISLTGDIFNPIEIISTDQREKLRQELFGQTKAAQPVATA